MQDEAHDGSEPADAQTSIDRLEQALERIGGLAHAGGPDAPTVLSSPWSVPPEVAHRLDTLIVQLRTALADRPGTD